MVILCFHTVQLYVQSMMPCKGSENKPLAEPNTSSSLFYCCFRTNCCGQIYSKADHVSDPGNTAGDFMEKGLFTFGQKNSTLREVK